MNALDDVIISNFPIESEDEEESGKSEEDRGNDVSLHLQENRKPPNHGESDSVSDEDCVEGVASNVLCSKM